MTHLFRRAFLTALLFAAQTAWAAPSAAADTLDTWCNDLGKRLRSVNASDCRKRDFQIAPERTSGSVPSSGRILQPHRKRAQPTAKPRVFW